jgi:DNA integrity scanning protein DisA with diadenylate cyclase activity
LFRQHTHAYEAQTHEIKDLLHILTVTLIFNYINKNIFSLKKHILTNKWFVNVLSNTMKYILYIEMIKHVLAKFASLQCYEQYYEQYICPLFSLKFQ